MRLIIVRHGETEYNKTGIHMGQRDVPLNDRGRRQAQLVGARLAGEKIDIIYTSDLQRASATAQEIAIHHPGTKLVSDQMLRERNVGVMTGQAIKPKDSIHIRGFDRMRRPENGESVHDVKQRAEEWLHKAKATHPNDSVVVVGHGLYLFVLLEVAVEDGADSDRTDFLLDHTSVTILDVHQNGRANVVHLNDTSHVDASAGNLDNK